MAFAHAFLTDPSAFPSASTARSWGSRTVDIDFAGGPYRFMGLDDAQEKLIRTRFGDLCRGAERPGEPAATTRIFQHPPEAFTAVDFSGCEYWFDRRYTEDRIGLAGLNFTAVIDRRPEVEAALWTCCNALEDFPMVFENFFRVQAAYRLLDLGGAILHSACVTNGSDAWLMVGHSGAGKSTFSRLARDGGLEVLSDDMNAILRTDGGWGVEKLPFTGDLGHLGTATGRRRLSGIFRLTKSAENRILPWSRGRAVAKAVSCTPVVNDDPFRTTDLLDLFARITAEVPTGILEFSLDGGALALLTDHEMVTDD